MFWYSSLLVVLGLGTPCISKLVTFSNVAPRLDSKGAILKAHDGTTQRFGKSGPYYYHAMGYPAVNETGKVNGCDGGIYGRKNSLLVYTSPDLSSGSWELKETVFPGGQAKFPDCTYFRSQGAFNPATKQYVLWANAVECVTSTCPNGTCAAYAMGTAATPQGPYTFVGMAEVPAASLPPKKGGQGDFAIFVDDSDGTGYIILTHLVDGAGHRDMFIFRLTADFLGFDVAGATGPLPGPHLVEAPAMFKRGNTYYALLGGCTCMGLYGGGVAVLTAEHPLGPWTNVTATLDPGCPMLKQKSCFDVGPPGSNAVCSPLTQAQQNYVIEVPLANGNLAWIWTGDKWQQSPDGKYDEQPQTWLPLEWDGDELLPLKYVDSFTLDVAV